MSASSALWNMGSEAIPVVPELIQALQDKETEVRQNAIYALIKALQDEDSLVRMNAALALATIGCEAAPAIPVLMEALKKDSQLPPCAAFALVQVEAQTSVPILIETLKDKKAYIRWRAAAALSNLGDAAKDAVPALTEALKDSNIQVQAAAASALEKISRSKRFSEVLPKVRGIATPLF